MNILVKQTATDLSNDWDSSIDEYYQSKEFLIHLEKYNYCNQRYYELYINAEFKAGAVVYSLKTNIFTFSTINLPFNLTIIGLPVSVSPQGLIGTKDFFGMLVNYILVNEKGIIQIQNADADLAFSKMISMRAMPCVAIKLPKQNFIDYLNLLRYPYRRKVKQALKEITQITIKQSKCIELTQEHYQLYLDVIEATNTRLETLSYDSFKYLTEKFILTTLYVNEGILSWHINCRDLKMSFYFGGLNYTLRDTYHGYYNNLISIINEGYEWGYSFIELGQTAELPKMRLGGELIEKKLFIYHKNKFYLLLFLLFKRKLGYYKKEMTLQVFKK